MWRAAASAAAAASSSSSAAFLLSLAQCSGETCGYAAAFLSCLSFGSFAVPMKGRAAQSVDVDPLVFQTYKTSVAFATSFLVLFLGVDRLRFTPWGLVSGLFWVPGGTLHICGVRTAGLAVSHGLASSLIVVVSFTWGIFVFRERVRSMAGAALAMMLMIVGICGMSYFSAPASGASSTKLVALEGCDDARRAIFCVPRGCLGGKVLTFMEKRKEVPRRNGGGGGGGGGGGMSWRGRGRKDASRPTLAALSPKKPASQRKGGGLKALESYGSRGGGSPPASAPSSGQTKIEAAILEQHQSLPSSSSSSSSPPPLSGNARNGVWISQEWRTHDDGSSGDDADGSGDNDSAILAVEPDLEQAPLVVMRDGSFVVVAEPENNPAVLSARTPRVDAAASASDHMGMGENCRDHAALNGDANDDDVMSFDAKALKPLAMGGSKAPRRGGGAHAIVSGVAHYINTKHGLNWTVRQTGLAFVAVGAIWGGSIMAPLHYAGEEAQGLGFVFSFAVGAMAINILLWILRYVYLCRVTGSPAAAYLSLPSFHFSTMIVPGTLSGALWSVGNMASMISVSHLGEGVGYSMTQSAMLVGGLWAIFYLKEISSGAAIRGWLASACLTIGGILLLSYNHLPPAATPVLKG